MVIPDNVQMWLVVIAVVIFGVGAIVFWLWEHILSIFFEIQRDTGKKYTKMQWGFIWLIGLLIVFVIIIVGIKYGIYLF